MVAISVLFSFSIATITGRKLIMHRLLHEKHWNLIEPTTPKKLFLYYLFYPCQYHSFILSV